jgi:NAD(P)-dependent dehydrogenase (short-subunit alcohol dehydrogenase family)
MNLELFSLENKTAIVTGAAGLLGTQHCKALADAGSYVYACDIDEVSCRNKFEGHESIYPVSIDITDKASITGVKNIILSKHGKIDILVNNAALNDKFEDPVSAKEFSMFENYPLELWNKSLEINLTGTFLMSQIIGTEMVKSGKGSIINIGSTYGIVAPDQNLYKKNDGTQTFYKSVTYPVTKSAVISLTKYLAAYWGNKGVRVNCISPGGVKNNQDEFFINNYSKKTPLGRMAEPEDFMGAVIFLASDASSYINGENLVVDGGFTIW